MSIKTLIKYAGDRIFNKLILYMVTTLLCCIAFAILLGSIFIWQFINYEKTECDRCLVGGIEQAGLIEIYNDGFGENEDKFLKEVMALDEVLAVGDCNLLGNGSEAFNELIARQNELRGTDNDYFSCFPMSTQATRICKFDLQSGDLPWEFDWNKTKGLDDEKDAEVILVYLGSAYSDIPVGNVYKEQNEDTVCIYYVAGILKKGMQWITEDLYMEEQLEDANYVENLDTMAVMVSNDDSHGSFRQTYVVKKNFSVEDTEKKIQDLGRKYNLDVRTALVSEIFKELDYQHSGFLDVIRHLFVLNIIVIGFLLLCTQFADIMDGLSDFGIFYANGATTKDLVLILLFENIIKIFVAFFISIGLDRLIIAHEWKIYHPGSIELEFAMKIFCSQTLWLGVSFGILFVFAISVIPIVWFKAKHPVELIHSYRV